MVKIFLVRHGQTVWNSEQKYMGSSDIALTEEGVRQAGKLADRLAAEKIGAVLASDLSRARTTAEAIAGRHGLPLLSDSGFREMNFGEWEGLTYAQIMGKWPELLQSLYENPGERCPPGGESANQVRQRATAALAEGLAGHPGKNLVVVAHGGVNRLLLCQALGLPTRQMWQIGQDAAALNILYREQEAWTLALWNDTCHLR